MKMEPAKARTSMLRTLAIAAILTFCTTPKAEEKASAPRSIAYEGTLNALGDRGDWPPARILYNPTWDLGSAFVVPSRATLFRREAVEQDAWAICREHGRWMKGINHISSSNTAGPVNFVFRYECLDKKTERHNRR